METMDGKNKPKGQIAMAWIVLALIAGVVASIFVPAQNSITEHGPVEVAVNQVKQLLLACRAYAADHEGRYPPALDALFPDYLDHKEALRIQNEMSPPLTLIYHPDKTEHDDPRSVLIEFPVVYEGKRVVGYVGGHILEVTVP